MLIQRKSLARLAALGIIFGSGVFFSPPLVPQAEAATVCTKSSRLNVRSGPSTGNRIVWKLLKGSYIEIDEYNYDFTWARVVYKYDRNGNALSGWVSTKYLCGG